MRTPIESGSEPKHAWTGRDISACAGMACGIGWLLIGWIWPVALVIAVVGLCLSLFGIKSRRRKMAIAGLVGSSIFLALFAYLTREEIAWNKEHARRQSVESR